MRVKQLSVFLENKSGRLAEVLSILAQAGINLRALSLADTRDFGVLRVIVDDVEKAHAVLQANGVTASETDVLAVEVPDQPGGLAGILGLLGKQSVSVEYMYAFVTKSGDKAVMIFRFDNVDQAAGVLQRGGVRILTGTELYSL
jgi:hypothetical protein